MRSGNIKLHIYYISLVLIVYGICVFFSYRSARTIEEVTLDSILSQFHTKHVFVRYKNGTSYGPVSLKRIYFYSDFKSENHFEFKDNWVVDKATGERGILFQFDTPKYIDNGKATIEVGYWLGGKWGRESVYSLERKLLGWKLTDQRVVSVY